MKEPHETLVGFAIMTLTQPLHLANEFRGRQEISFSQ